MRLSTFSALRRDLEQLQSLKFPCYIVSYSDNKKRTTGSLSSSSSCLSGKAACLFKNKKKPSLAGKISFEHPKNRLRIRAVVFIVLDLIKTTLHEGKINTVQYNDHIEKLT
jgi:hypothetical protein